MAQAITETEAATIALLKDTLNIDIQPGLARDFSPQNPIAMGDWHLWPRDTSSENKFEPILSLSTAYLTQAQITAMRQELADAVAAALKDVDTGTHEFFVSQIGMGYHKNEDSIAIPLSSLEFLKSRGIKVDASGIATKYHAQQQQYLNDVTALGQRINNVTGYPVWQTFAYIAHPDNKPFLHMEMPEGTVDTAATASTDPAYSNFWDKHLPYNYSRQIRKFIADHQLGDVIKYEPRSHRDGHDCRFTIEAPDLDKLRAVVERLEGELQPEFQKLMQEMLLAATPQRVTSSLNYGALLNALMDMGSGTVQELRTRVNAQPSVQEIAGMRDLTERTNTESMGEMISMLRQLAADQTYPYASQATEQLAMLSKRIPALGPVINAEHPANQATAIGAEAQKIRALGNDVSKPL